MPPTAKTRRMNGDHAVVDCLRSEGVRHVFNVPGESFTSILDGMRDAKVQQAWATPPERPTGKVSMEKVMMDMQTTLPKDTIHTVDAGNFAL